MPRRMKIIRPRPQGRAFDVNGTMIKTGEIGLFDEATIARAPHWFEPAPKPPKPKQKPKAAKTAKPKAKATKKSTKKAIKRSTTEPK